MRRSAKPAKAKVRAKPTVVRNSRKNEGSRVGDLETRLAEALKLKVEALEQLTATSEILGVISSSPTDVQPVFDAIAERAMHLCGASSGAVTRFDGELVHIAALANVDPEEAAAIRSVFPMPPSRRSAAARAVLTHRIVHIPDVRDEPEYGIARQVGAAFRSVVAVPMLQKGKVIGAVAVGRPGPGQFSERQIALLQTFAAQAVIAIENVRLFTELQEKNQALTKAHAQVTEALEQQTATSEILRVISSSPTDAQPVFDAIARNAMRLCDAAYSVIGRFDGQLLHLAAHAHVRKEGVEAVERRFPLRPTRAITSTRAILDRTVVHVPDVLKDPEYDRSVALAIQNRTTLAVPMLHDGEPIGSISVGRLEPRPFSGKQIELLRTFADQAVIAIENVRLFTQLQTRNRELGEALEHQTATAEILRVISSSPTDVQPVMDTVAANAARVCGANDAFILRADGDALELVAHYGSAPTTRTIGERIPLTRGTIFGRAVADRQTIHIKDFAEAVETDFPEQRERQRQTGIRTFLATPLLREGVPIGVIAIRRTEVRPFTDTQIALLRTFADQAVIAIENVRLFKELEVRNEELTGTLARQTATGEVLRAISRVHTDAQPVFDILAASALRLCGATYSWMALYDGELLHLATFQSLDPTLVEPTTYPKRPDEGTSEGRAILTRAVAHIPDVLEDPLYRLKTEKRTMGFRANLAVPVLRDGQPIGVIGVLRPEPGRFPESQVELLQTFADQAVIAIENVRLFTVLEAKNRDLTEALEQQTATSEILRVISRSPTDVQPVFDTIARNAARLCEANYSSVNRFDGELLTMAAAHGFTPGDFVAAQANFPRRAGRESAVGRAVLTRAAVHIHDVTRDPEYRFPAQAQIGYRTILGVPMLREGVPIGAVAIWRREVRPFSEAQIALVTTFAAQAVIAVENVRLFKELEARNRDLAASAEILRIISSSPTDVQPVFDAIAEGATHLCEAFDAAIFRRDGDRLLLVAHHGSIPTPGPVGETTLLLGRGSTVGRAVLDRQSVHLTDLQTEDDEFPESSERARREGWKAVLSVPLMHEGDAIGVIALRRTEAELFTDRQVSLLQTFADQAVIAIENVRLFTELQERTRELARSVEELKALGEVGQAVSSTLDLETVLNTIASRAAQLAGADAAAIVEYDEATREFPLRATHNYDPELVEAARAMPIRMGEGLSGLAAERREPMQVPDIVQEGAYRSHLRDLLLRMGFRALLAVPLVREDQIIGALVVNRRAPGEFAPEVVELLKTFGTQSALAIQNARLFREIADTSRQLEAASRHKSEFLANMSHELRTPLNAILGFSEVLAERMFGEVNEKQAEYLQDILASGRHLLSLINDILDLSKVEAGRLELELGRFHLPAALDNALTLVRERASQHGITLDLAVDPEIGEVVADERKVKQILLNLLSNAVKFTPEGGRVGLTATAAENAITIAISDTGVGIAAADQATIFEEFRQVGTGSQKQEGTGLGLTLTKKFVELHGGRIGVQSQVGQGSTFTFTLPVRPEGG